MSKYYLKDHVTDEMLVAVGFRLVNFVNVRATRLKPNGKLMFVETPSNMILWADDDSQDLIELGYVEVRND